MKRTFDLKRRESKELPPEKLKEILSKIYPEEIVKELMGKLVENETPIKKECEKR